MLAIQASLALFLTVLLPFQVTILNDSMRSSSPYGPFQEYADEHQSLSVFSREKDAVELCRTQNPHMVTEVSYLVL